MLEHVLSATRLECVVDDGELCLNLEPCSLSSDGSARFGDGEKFWIKKMELRGVPVSASTEDQRDFALLEEEGAEDRGQVFFGPFPAPWDSFLMFGEATVVVGMLGSELTDCQPEDLERSLIACHSRDSEKVFVGGWSESELGPAAGGLSNVFRRMFGRLRSAVVVASRRQAAKKASAGKKTASAKKSASSVKPKRAAKKSRKVKRAKSVGSDSEEDDAEEEDEPEVEYEEEDVDDEASEMDAIEDEEEADEEETVEMFEVEDSEEEDDEDEDEDDDEEDETGEDEEVEPSPRQKAPQNPVFKKPELPNRSLSGHVKPAPKRPRVPPAQLQSTTFRADRCNVSGTTFATPYHATRSTPTYEPVDCDDGWLPRKVKPFRPVVPVLDSDNSLRSISKTFQLSEEFPIAEHLRFRQRVVDNPVVGPLQVACPPSKLIRLGVFVPKGIPDFAS
jgi:hypothetical protein